MIIYSYSDYDGWQTIQHFIKTLNTFMKIKLEELERFNFKI